MNIVVINTGEGNVKKVLSNVKRTKPDDCEIYLISKGKSPVKYRYLANVIEENKESTIEELEQVAIDKIESDPEDGLMFVLTDRMLLPPEWTSELLNIWNKVNTGKVEYGMIALAHFSPKNDKALLPVTILGKPYLFYQAMVEDLGGFKQGYQKLQDKIHKEGYKTGYLQKVRIEVC